MITDGAARGVFLSTVLPLLLLVAVWLGMFHVTRVAAGLLGVALVATLIVYVPAGVVSGVASVLGSGVTAILSGGQ